MEKAALNFLDHSSRLLFDNASAGYLNNHELEITIKDNYDIFRDTEEKVNMTICLFHNTINVYTDCCTESSIGVCTKLMVMCFACFLIYGCIIFYIMNKKTRLKEQGMYINVFSFQICVLLLRGFYYSYYGRTSNQSLNWYMALRTAPLICSILSMTSYTLHLIVMIYKYR